MEVPPSAVYDLAQIRNRRMIELEQFIGLFLHQLGLAVLKAIPIAERGNSPLVRCHALLVDGL
jgi:hypothetical protein